MVSGWLVMIVVVTVITSSLGSLIIPLLCQIQLIFKLQKGETVRERGRGREEEREREMEGGRERE
ncbi:MAG: hypothetical protein MJE68_05555 [Proteobacteria bacterium]|nr:hypothetical protein [Pseudomonadota bacterium]